MSKHGNGGRLIDAAERHGLRTKRGKGDHVIIFAPVGRGYMTCPDREIGKGLEKVVTKWLVAAGVTLGFLALLGVFVASIA
jgi:hypothetical protein